MLKNFIAEVVHATKRLKTRFLTVTDKADINLADIQEIIDNGTVYGKSTDIRRLIVEPELKEGEEPRAGINCNYEGSIPKPSRADHVHRIPGRGTKLTFGHVRLCDDIDKDYDEMSGWAATPKALQNLSQLFLKLDGTSLMKGTIKAKGNASGTAIADLVPGIQFGANSYITDFGIPNTMAITGRQNPNIGSVAFGLDKSTILMSKQTGHLYVRNDSQAMKDKGFTIDGERMLVDYVIEDVLIPKGDSDTASINTFWTPARAGWYRIYVVGPGGTGAPGYAMGITSYTGAYGTGSDKAVASYTSPKDPVGFALAGCGGGGGGCAITDIYVSKDPYSYISKKNGKITVEVCDDDGNPVGTETEEVFIESPVLKKIIVKINIAQRSVKLSNVFAATGTTRVIESEAAGEEAIEEIADLQEEESPICAYGGFDAIVGKVTQVAKYSRKNGVVATSAGTDWGESLINRPIMAQWYGVPVKRTCTYRTDMGGDGMTYTQGCYFLRQGMRWDKAEVFNSKSEADMAWMLYSSSGSPVMKNGKPYYLPQGSATIPCSFQHMITEMSKDEKQQSGFGKGEGLEFKPYSKFTNTCLERVGREFEVGKHLGLPVVSRSVYSKFDDTTTNLYSYYDVIYSTPGLGGHATGGDVNYTGTKGDNPNATNLMRTGQGEPLRRAVDKAKYEKMSWSTDVSSSIAVDHNGRSLSRWKVCADGCCGGVPGEIGVTGAFGANGGAGSISQSAPYERKMVEGKLKDIPLGTVFARCGYGGGLCISELGNYTGEGTPSKLTAKSGGPGKYGGGGGGGCAVVVKGKGGRANVQKYKGAKGGNGCVIIAFFGDSKPKEQTIISGMAPSMDKNKDGIDDYMQVAITYVASDDGSVGDLQYNAYKCYVTLKDENGNLYEGGTGTITKDQRPTVVTPAKGYKGNPIYVPNTTHIDANFSGKITVSFAKDASKWFNITFSPAANGTLVGECIWNDVLVDTPYILDRGDIPIPDPDEGEEGGESGGETGGETGGEGGNTGSETEPVAPASVPVTISDTTTGEETPAVGVIVPTPLPDEGYEFEKWTYKPASGGITKTGIPETVKKSLNFTAHFKKKPVVEEEA